MRTEPFSISIDDQILVDLRRRLAQTRWAGEPARSGYADQRSVEYARSLVDWWGNGFDWRAQEAALNSVPHFRATVGGVLLHFVHARGRGPRPMPLVLTHGWPSTFYEYSKIIPLLVDPAAHGADPADSFDVVVPALPGYPFSEPLPPGGFSRVAELWARLMTDVLGYERFGAYGGDIGGMVTNRIALEFPHLLAGIATSFPAEPYLGPGAAPLSSDEQAVVASRRRDQERGLGAYVDIGRTHPASLGLALNDSPAALAAWIVWFWREWSDCDGDVERRFTKDELLTTVTLYWAAQAIGSSFRPYVDWALGTAGRPAVWQDGPSVPSGVDSRPLDRHERIDVPAALLLFSLVRFPREWVERAYTDIRRFAEMPRGGHFAAMEEPELLAEEIRAFYRPLRGRES